MSLAFQYMATTNPLGQEKGRVSHRMKIPLLWLVTPNPGYGIYGLHVCVAAEVFRWMVASGDKYRTRQRWGDVGPRELLDLTSAVNCRIEDCHCFGGEHGCCYTHNGNGKFIESIRARFHAALLWISRAQSIHDWRRDHGLLDVYREKIFPIRYYRPQWSAGPQSSADAEKLIQELFAVKDRRLAKSWNSCHKKARSAHYSYLQCQPEGWRLCLRYGDRDESSNWGIEVARQGKSEVFADFVLRAKANLDRLFVKQTRSAA